MKAGGDFVPNCQPVAVEEAVVLDCRMDPQLGRFWSDSLSWYLGSGFA